MLRERRRHANFKPNRKLDRKSSRGMIYENEELRLRTININAEVERGQSDIKKLRRENYQLRKEIWSLRDEYDRLGKLLKTNNRGVDDRRDDSIECINDCKYGYDHKDFDPCCSCRSNEDDISCDICQENEQCTNQFNVSVTENAVKLDKMRKPISGVSAVSIPKSQRNDKIDLNFDHLSIVSEECLSNNEEHTETQSNKNAKERSIDETDIPEFQSTIPPLEHFENLSYRDIGPNIDTLIKNELVNNNEAFCVPQEDSLPEAESKITPVISSEKTSIPKFLTFAPLKSKRKLIYRPAESQNERPDVCVDNVFATETKKVATIRKPHKPLKCPIYSNVASDNETEFSDNVSQDMRRDIMSIDANELRSQQRLNDENADLNRSSDSDPSHPYRTEMSLVLSYNGNQSKYSTVNSNDSDIEPTLSLPSAMKLLPNRLVYTTPSNRLEDEPESKLLQNGIRKDTEKNSTNVENKTNEVILSPPSITFEKAETETDCTKYSSENIHNELYGNTSDVDNIKKTSESKSSTLVNSINAVQNLNDDDYEEKQKGEFKDQNKCGRRVSIQFNGKPLEKQHETMPSNSNDCDANCTDCDIEEPIAITPTSFRLRRASCNRKFSDESFGSLLYPPSSFFGYKRGKKSFLSSAFGPRRHSDTGLIPSYQSQHYSEYNVSSKNHSRHNCHRTHNHHHHKMEASAGPCGANNINNPIDGSTGTSMCNSFGSSRESSTSISQRSISKRKLSITSHTQNGKIPWCACWGNGCI